jgi:hypothetical protein
LAFFSHDPFKQSLAFTAAGAVLRQEHHPHGIVARAGQFESPMRALVREKSVRNLEQDARPVARVSLTPASSPMLKIQEHLNRLVDNPARTATLNVNDEAQTARVMFEPRVVKSLLCRAGRLFHLLRIDARVLGI